jgi:HEAT repeat protein
LEKIHDASVTYDPAQLPVIAEFLLHENPEVRKAAIDGMIVLGDSAAAPLLRQAALSAPTPQEAVALEEAAAYMELPSASLLKKR